MSRGLSLRRTLSVGAEKAFARDLEAIFTDLESLSAQLTVSGTSGTGGEVGVSASIAFDDSQMNRLILQVRPSVIRIRLILYYPGANFSRRPLRCPGVREEFWIPGD